MEPKPTVPVEPIDHSCPSVKAVPMMFQVHIGGKICLDTKHCWDWRVGSLNFLDARHVNWYDLQENLKVFGYRGKAEVYYLIPGYKPPDGLVLMLCEEQVSQSMEKHRGRKKMRTCDLYIVKKPRPGTYDCGYSSSSEDDSMDDEKFKYPDNPPEDCEE